ncbi:MAG: hypothetical protein NVS4B2_11420 [Chloroflexota bacterium]
MWEDPLSATGGAERGSGKRGKGKKGRELRGDAAFQLFFEITFVDAGWVERPVDRRYALRKDTAAAARTAKMSGLIDDEMVALVHSQEYKALGWGIALTFNLADLISTGQATEFCMKTHGGVSPIRGSAASSPLIHSSLIEASVQEVRRACRDAFAPGCEGFKRVMVTCIHEELFLLTFYA